MNIGQSESRSIQALYSLLGYSRQAFYKFVKQSEKEALQMALNNNPQLGRLIHHSDRGSQYCCADYVSILDKHFIKISMTQSGDPVGKRNRRKSKRNVER